MPIPTLPAESMRARSRALVNNASGYAPCDAIKGALPFIEPI